MLQLNDISKLRSDVIGFFRFKKFDDSRYLITNDVGMYSFLEKEDFLHFIAGKIDALSSQKKHELAGKKFILDDSYANDMAHMYETKNTFLKQGPALHIMVLTLRCNHACKYCHASIVGEKITGKDMTVEIAQNVVDTIFYSSSNEINIEFQGGEPLLNYEVLKFIVAYARKRAKYLGKHVNFLLITNLSLMDEEKMNYLIDNNVQLSTSLDGDEEVHNSNRTYAKGNSFEKVVYWIDRINTEYKKRGIKNTIGALTTVTKKGLGRWKELVDLYLSLGMKGVFIRPLNPYGFARHNLDELGYTPQEFNEFYDNIIRYITEINKKGTKFREYFTTIYLQKILNNQDPNFVDERSPCGATIGQVAYNYTGKIYTCDEGRMFSEMGDENFQVTTATDNPEENYKNMIDSDVTKSMMQASLLDAMPGYNESVYKPYIGICPVNNYKKTGNIFPNYKHDDRIVISTHVLDYIFSKIEDPEYFSMFQGWVGGNDFNISCDL
ncbi:His-Xaa-Ser system radical SAM maturase HxsB [Candidatus Gracilibacteria bacterium]|nr:His-Xaa-Ser system radical SAM maturase HxsB [Candidatus Gracilibacteria bacterium]